MSAPVERAPIEHAPRIIPPLNDEWIANTISGAFETVGLGRTDIHFLSQPLRYPSLIENALNDETSTAVLVDGKPAMFTGDGDNLGMFKSLMKISRSLVTEYESPAVSEGKDTSDDEIREILEQGIEFTVAISERLNDGASLRSALFNIGWQERDNYKESGFYSDQEVRDNVMRNVRFAAEVFVDRSKHDDNLTDAGKANEADLIRSLFEGSESMIFLPVRKRSERSPKGLAEEQERSRQRLEEAEKRRDEVSRQAEERGLRKDGFFEGVWLDATTEVEDGKFPDRFFTDYTVNGESGEHVVFAEHTIPEQDPTALVETLTALNILYERNVGYVRAGQDGTDGLIEFVQEVGERKGTEDNKS